ncbi:MAG TPA: phasin family protein [Stellaceae bacterium]|nr:phasin family protein [Stellaceae bacterium]
MATKSKKATSVPALATEAAPAAADSMGASAWRSAGPLFSALSLEDFADLSRENFAALTKSNLALAEGWNAMTEEVLGYARTALASASQTATALLTAKTLDEVIQLNSELARTSVESLLQQSSKLSEMGVTCANEAFAPLGGRVEATIAKLTKVAA